MEGYDDVTTPRNAPSQNKHPRNSERTPLARSTLRVKKKKTTLARMIASTTSEQASVTGQGNRRGNDIAETIAPKPTGDWADDATYSQIEMTHQMMPGLGGAGAFGSNGPFNFDPQTPTASHVWTGEIGQVLVAGTQPTTPFTFQEAIGAMNEDLSTKVCCDRTKQYMEESPQRSEERNNDNAAIFSNSAEDDNAAGGQAPSANSGPIS